MRLPVNIAEAVFPYHSRCRRMPRIRPGVQGRGAARKWRSGAAAATARAPRTPTTGSGGWYWLAHGQSQCQKKSSLGHHEASRIYSSDHGLHFSACSFFNPNTHRHRNVIYYTQRDRLSPYLFSIPRATPSSLHGALN